MCQRYETRITKLLCDELEFFCELFIDFITVNTVKFYYRTSKGRKLATTLTE